MSSRLDRLMRLAQKTGDTLIVHDKTGHDVVILDVDQYEMMHDMQDSGYDMCDCECNEELHNLSEKQMLDKINRDIAIWRSHKDMDEAYENGEELAHDVEHEPPFDPFEEDMSDMSNWHTASDVLEQKKSELIDQKQDIQNESTIFDDLETFSWDDDSEEDLVDFELPQEDEKSTVADDVEYDELGEDSIFGEIPQEENEKQTIPYISHDDVEIDSPQEDLDDDEPVFFEEPV